MTTFLYDQQQNTCISNSEKVDGACGMSSWRNRCAPSLADNAGPQFHNSGSNLDYEVLELL